MKVKGWFADPDVSARRDGWSICRRHMQVWSKQPLGRVLALGADRHPGLELLAARD